jgi:hypothetical protein
METFALLAALRISESQANLIEDHALRLNVHRQTGLLFFKRR